MKVLLSDRAIEALKDAPAAVRRGFYKQIRFLAENLQYPSLQAKKYNEAQNLWQPPRQSRLALLLHHCRRHLLH
jgi:hypothetical protein